MSALRRSGSGGEPCCLFRIHWLKLPTRWKSSLDLRRRSSEAGCNAGLRVSARPRCWSRRGGFHLALENRIRSGRGQGAGLRIHPRRTDPHPLNDPHDGAFGLVRRILVLPESSLILAPRAARTSSRTVQPARTSGTHDRPEPLDLLLQEREHVALAPELSDSGQVVDDRLQSALNARACAVPAEKARGHQHELLSRR